VNPSRAARRRAETHIARLGRAPIPDLPTLRDRLSYLRGRPLQLLPLRRQAELTGVWVALPTTDVIGYRQDTSRPHQRRIICHEAGHMLAGHDPVPVSAADCAQLLVADFPGDLIPDLLAGAVIRMLARGGYGSAVEDEAELIAGLLCQRFQRSRGDRRTRDLGVAAVLNRLESAMDGDEE
jgi:hypothetical protein